MEAALTGMPGTNSLAPDAQTPKVIAGLMCPPDLYATSTPAKTAIPHPQLTNRKPVPAPLFLGRTLLATTPPPKRSSIAVPTTSERKIVPRDTVTSFRHPCGCHSSPVGRPQACSGLTGAAPSLVPHRFITIRWPGSVIALRGPHTRAVEMIIACGAQLR